MPTGRHITLLSAVLAVFVGSAQPVRATVVVIDTGRDNTLYESPTGSLSDGEGAYFFAGRTGQGVNSIRRGLIAFDIVGNIPAGSTINSVELTLNMSKTPSSTQRTIELRLATADWGEGPSDDVGGEGSGTQALAGDATWLHTFFNTDFWTAPGGDFTATASASQNVGALGVYTWSSTAEMVADVQAWLDTPAGNFGWVLLGDESVTRTAKRFDSLQNTVSSNRPALTVDFTPGPVPAIPTVSVWGAFIMALSLAAAATVLLERRSRLRS